MWFVFDNLLLLLIFYIIVILFVLICLLDKIIELWEFIKVFFYYESD